MRTITFTVYGRAVPKGSLKAFIPKGWTRPVLTSTSKGLKAWEQEIAAAAHGQARGKLITGPVYLRVVFHLPRPKAIRSRTAPHVTRPDLDKLVRSAGDALTKVLWKDDAQVMGIGATKHYVVGDGIPRAEFVVSEL